MFSFSFLVSLFLIRMPPFYVFPFVKSSLLTSHSISRLLVLGLFCLMLWKKEYLKIKTTQIGLFTWYLGYLFFHSISLFNAVNVETFLLRYKDVVFPGLFLLVSFVYIKSKKSFTRVLAFSLIINFLYQFVAYLWPSLYSVIGRVFLYDGHLEFVAFNLSRGRIFIETYDEIVFPFLFISASYVGIRSKLLVKVLPFLIVIPTLLSNFRSRLLMLVVSVGLTLLAWFRSWKVFLWGLLISLILFFFVDNLSLRLWNFSLLDRVLLRSNYDDVQSLTSRWEGITRSFELGVSHPIAGIGLGNYFDFLPTSTRISVFSIVNYYGSVWIASLNPHNIFAQIVAETGLLGLAYYLAMLIAFCRTDFKIMQLPNKSPFSTASVIAFWSLFSYAVFNPSTTLTFNTLFWMLRAMIIYESSR